MDGAGDTGNLNQPMLPLLLLDGEDLEEGAAGGGGDTLVHQMDTLSTDEVMVHGHCSSPSTERFEKIIGAIEEIVVGDEFQSLQNHFLSTYWKKFAENHDKEDEDEQNSEDAEQHEHFKIFQAYSQDMAHLLETQLKRAFRDEPFDFNQFVEEFGRRVQQGDNSNGFLESEIFEMLFTLTDFVKFKELFMDYKAMMEGKTPNLSTGITLKPLPTTPR